MIGEKYNCCESCFYGISRFGLEMRTFCLYYYSVIGFSLNERNFFNNMKIRARSRLFREFVGNAKFIFFLFFCFCPEFFLKITFSAFFFLYPPTMKEIHTSTSQLHLISTNHVCWSFICAKVPSIFVWIVEFFRMVFFSWGFLK